MSKKEILDLKNTIKQLNQKLLNKETEINRLKNLLSSKNYINDGDDEEKECLTIDHDLSINIDNDFNEYDDNNDIKEEEETKKDHDEKLEKNVKIIEMEEYEQEQICYLNGRDKLMIYGYLRNCADVDIMNIPPLIVSKCLSYYINLIDINKYIVIIKGDDLDDIKPLSELIRRYDDNICVHKCWIVTFIICMFLSLLSLLFAINPEWNEPVLICGIIGATVCLCLACCMYCTCYLRDDFRVRCSEGILFDYKKKCIQSIKCFVDYGLNEELGRRHCMDNIHEPIIKIKRTTQLICSFNNIGGIHYHPRSAVRGNQTNLQWERHFNFTIYYFNDRYNKEMTWRLSNCWVEWKYKDEWAEKGLNLYKQFKNIMTNLNIAWDKQIIFHNIDPVSL